MEEHKRGGRVLMIHRVVLIAGCMMGAIGTGNYQGQGKVALPPVCWKVEKSRVPPV